MNLALVRSCCLWILLLSETTQCWMRIWSAAVTTWSLTYYFYMISVNYYCCWSYSESSSAKTDLYRSSASQLLSETAHSFQYIVLAVVYFSLYFSALSFFKHYLILHRFMIKISQKMKRRSSSHNIASVCWSVYWT